METNTYGVGSGTTTPTTQSQPRSVVGVNLNQLLDMSSGKVDRATLTTDAERKMYDEVAPKYDSVQVRATIEEMALYRSLEPHLVDIHKVIPEPVPVLSHFLRKVSAIHRFSTIPRNTIFHARADYTQHRR